MVICKKFNFNGFCRLFNYCLTSAVLRFPQRCTPMLITATLRQYFINLKLKTMKTKQEKYIANGKCFSSYEDVCKYAETLNMRITNTETIKKGVYLITLNS